MAERIYQALNGKEAAAWLEGLMEQVRGRLASHPHLREHIAWPRAEAQVSVKLWSTDSQPTVELSLSSGPVLAPDDIRQELSLPVPHALVDRVGKKEVTTKVSARVSATSAKSGKETN